MTDQVQQIPLDLLEDHPDNPRLFLREDVIDGIAAQLRESGRFDPAHALLVRPLNGHYQIVRGHHRKEAAKRAGMDAVPCWVREMGDEEAYMQLALGNVQGELSPLEIGRHVYGAVELGKGGRGLEGGLSEYGRNIGKTKGYITQVRQAAIVLENIKPFSQLNRFIDKAPHLASIHATPCLLWPMLAEWIIIENGKGKQPSANQVSDLTTAIQKLATPLYEWNGKTPDYDRPSEWQDIFLPIEALVAQFMEKGKPTPDEVGRLVNAARGIRELIDEHENRLDPARFPYSVAGFLDWLRAGMGTYAWELPRLEQYRREVIEVAQKATAPPEPHVKSGEWYRLGKHTLYCGDTGADAFWRDAPLAPFAFADPPYNAESASWDSGFKWRHDWLITKAPIVAVTPGIGAIQRFFQTDTTMTYTWSIGAWLKNGMTRGALGFGNWIYVAVFTRADAKLPTRQQDYIECTIKTSKSDETDHKGRKPGDLMARLIDLFTKEGDTIIDPFLGSGTTLFEAGRLGRACFGGEIEPEFCNEIITRWQEMTGMAAEKINGTDAVQ